MKNNPTTINYDLDTVDLVNLICGLSIGHSLLDHPFVKRNGNYTGGFNDIFTWKRYELEKIPTQTLLKYYLELKDKCK